MRQYDMQEKRREIKPGLEMGDNVMIYLDDIHRNPEFLQKFISLCDAQRKTEGVYKGKSKRMIFEEVCAGMAGTHLPRVEKISNP